MKIQKRNNRSNVTVFYINDEGDLFIQLRDRMALSSYETGSIFNEYINGGYFVKGYIYRIPKTGLTLKNWQMK